MNENREPYKLRRVSRQTMQGVNDSGAIREELGSVPNIAQVTDDNTGMANVENKAESREEEEVELSTEMTAHGGTWRSSKQHNGKKRKRSSSVASAASAEAGMAPVSLDTGALNAHHRRGRKAGGPKKGNARPWTDAEGIALLKLYVDNPRETHKAVAEMHHAKFWASDTQWEGRSFSACQQRMIALNNKSRDRARLPRVLAKMRSAATVTSDADDVDDSAGVMNGKDEHGLGEVDGDDGDLKDGMGGEADGKSANAKGKQRKAAQDDAAASRKPLGEAQDVGADHDGSPHTEEDAAAELAASDTMAARLLMSLLRR